MQKFKLAEIINKVVQYRQKLLTIISFFSILNYKTTQKDSRGSGAGK